MAESRRFLDKRVYEVLEEFEHHNLQEISKLKLMNRIDTKFIIPMTLFESILRSLKADYSVLKIDGTSLFLYKNTYYDTKDYKSYKMHHNGKQNRFKVRNRHYADNDLMFMEVKLRTNKKRTIKTRIETDSTDIDSLKNNEFVQQILGNRYEPLVSSQVISYNRISLADKQRTERLTLDFNLGFQKTLSGQKQSLDHMFIIELKQNKKNRNSPFYRIGRKNKLKNGSFSKYCIGCCLNSQDHIKINNFKPKLLEIARTKGKRRLYVD